jgi:hypothetical protein
MTISTPQELFAAAVTEGQMSAADRELIERVTTTSSEEPLSDDQRDAVIHVVVKDAMRAGKTEQYIGFPKVSGAQLHVMAHRWREAGYDAEVKLGLPWYLTILLFERTPGVEIRWNPSELAAQVAAEAKNKPPSE